MNKLLFLVLTMAAFNLSFAKDPGTWYYGAGYGNADYQAQEFNNGLEWFDPNDNFFALTTGYVLNHHITFEASYLDLGNVQDSFVSITSAPNTLSIDTSGLSFSTLIGFDLIEQFHLSGKFGISILDIEKQWSGGVNFPVGFQDKMSSTETNFFVGASLQYKINNAFILSLNWDRYQLDGINDSSSGGNFTDLKKIDIDALYLSLSHFF